MAEGPAAYGAAGRMCWAAGSRSPGLVRALLRALAGADLGPTGDSTTNLQRAKKSIALLPARRSIGAMDGGDDEAFDQPFSSSSPDDEAFTPKS